VAICTHRTALGETEDRSIVAIYAMLIGELPPRHLPEINPQSTVVEVQAAIQPAFKERGSLYRLRYDGTDLTNETASLSEYGVPEEALISAEAVTCAEPR
jgi:hypothetical protein